MAEAAGGREQPAAGRASADAPHRAEEEPEPPSLDAPAGAAGRRRERRSGVSAVGTAERFPGGSLGPAAAPDPDACLLEAAKATPRRSSIIKIRPRIVFIKREISDRDKKEFMLLNKELVPADLQADLCHAAVVLLGGAEGASLCCPAPCSDIHTEWKFVGVLQTCHVLTVHVNDCGRSGVVDN
ncbi:hypothetical protein BTVI_19459 [Pitangus sulphuratus]|nr:hypothetical protein BTVI_19459 [Pitangus sulphuratus]